KSPTGIQLEVALVEHRVTDARPSVEHGVGVQLAFEKSLIELLIQRQTVAEVVALERGQAALEQTPVQRLGTGHPVGAQPAGLPATALYPLPEPLAQLLPERVEVGTAGMHHAGAALTVAERQEQGVTGPGWRQFGQALGQCRA